MAAYVGTTIGALVRSTAGGLVAAGERGGGRGESLSPLVIESSAQLTKFNVYTIANHLRFIIFILNLLWYVI